MGTLRPALIAALALTGCFLDRTGLSGERCASQTDCEAGEVCLDGACVRQVDAGRDAGPSGDAGPGDAGSDGGTDAGIDAGGGPAHCVDGRMNAGETDVDCGGECSPCGSCLRCELPADCISGTCESTRCRPALTNVLLPGAASDVRAQVEGGRVLLAHYAPRTWQREYDPSVAQITTRAGGEPAPAEWAPDACFDSGHLAFGGVVPAGRRVFLECGRSATTIDLSVPATLFTTFTSGTYGMLFADGDPGWAAIASLESGAGRSNFEMCGSGTSNRRGGIAYCDGRHSAASSNGFDNHLVSFTTWANSNGSWIGCDRMGCTADDDGCNLHVWVWLEL